MCTIVGNNWSLCLCIFFFNLLNLVFCHIYGTKYEINF